MKQILILAMAITISTVSFAQAHYASTEYNKQTKPAVVTDIPFSDKTVIDAIEDKMTKLGYKGSNSKGFTVYRTVRLPELGSGAYDLYYTVDRVSKKDKGNCTVTLMLSKGFETFVSDTSDATLIESAKNYLNTLRGIVAAYDLEQQINDQENAVKKADKKYNNLVDDGNDLQKRKRKLEEEIEKNIKDQKNQQDEQAKQRQVLEILRGQRKS